VRRREGLGKPVQKKKFHLQATQPFSPMLYKGEYRRTIDEQGRLELPDTMRQAGNHSLHTITRGLEACLFLYPEDRWTEIEEKMGELDDARSESRHFYRTVLRWAFDLDTDEAGRIEIPPGLKEFAGLEQEALILGAFDHVELWDPGRFGAYLKSKDDYTTLVERIVS
jgi:MraZ protein